LEAVEKRGQYGKRLLGEMQKVFGAGAHLLGENVVHMPHAHAYAAFKCLKDLRYLEKRGPSGFEKVFEPNPKASEEHFEVARKIFGVKK